MNRRRVFVGIGLVTLVWAVVAYAVLDAARDSAASAEAAGESALELLEAGDLSEARALLAEAAAQLDDAGDGLDGMAVFPLRLVPFVGTEVRAADAGVVAAGEAAGAALEVLEFIEGERPPLLHGDVIDPQVFESFEGVLEDASTRSRLAQSIIDDAPRPRLETIERRLRRLDELVDGMGQALDAAVAMAGRVGTAVDGGDPYRVLLLVENGAELRATAGLPGFVALLVVDDGRLVLERAREVHDLALQDQSGDYISVDAPADYVARYGEFGANSTLWLNVNLSPDFPTVADVAARLYEVATGVSPDAVVRIDLVGVGYALSAFADLTVDGEPFRPGELATDFLLDSYRRFPGNDLHSPYLAAVFDQVFDQLLGGATGDSGEMLRGLRRAVDENRLGVYSREVDVDDALRRAGLDGAMMDPAPGAIDVRVQNFGANKVDLFTTTAVDVDVDAPGCHLTGRLGVTLGNGLPADVDFLPAGQGGRNGVWWVSFYLPPGAAVTALEVNGEAALGSVDTELGRPVAAVLVEAPPGMFVTAAVEWTEALQGPGYEIRIDAQPHLVPASLAVNGETSGDLVELRSFPVETGCGSGT